MGMLDKSMLDDIGSGSFSSVPALIVAEKL